MLFERTFAALFAGEGAGFRPLVTASEVLVRSDNVRSVVAVDRGLLMFSCVLSAGDTVFFGVDTVWRDVGSRADVVDIPVSGCTTELPVLLVALVRVCSTGEDGCSCGASCVTGVGPVAGGAVAGESLLGSTGSPGKLGRLVARAAGSS